MGRETLPSLMARGAPLTGSGPLSPSHDCQGAERRNKPLHFRNRGHSCCHNGIKAERMKKLLVAGTLTAVLAVLAGAVVAQQTRREEVRSSGAAEDARPNSSNVPDVYAIAGQFDRVLILRFKYQTDLLAGMEKMVKEQHVKNAVILSAIG